VTADANEASTGRRPQAAGSPDVMDAGLETSLRNILWAVMAHPWCWQDAWRSIDQVLQFDSDTTMTESLLVTSRLWSVGRRRSILPELGAQSTMMGSASCIKCALKTDR
jgi:hypothetical protein